MTEVLIIGAGITGASAAFHLAERGARVLVLDPSGGTAGQTPRSGAIVRGHHAVALEAELAVESLGEYYERWDERVGGGCGFTRTGFAYLADEADAPAVRANTTMLAEQLGWPTELLSAEQLAELEPAVDTARIRLAAYEERSGYAEPMAATTSLLRAAGRHGAQLRHERVLGLLAGDSRIRGVRTESGEYHADTVLLATGAWSPALAATTGLELPIASARIQVMLYERPYSLAGHLTMTDVAGDIYLRPTADRCTLVGRHAPEREWLAGPEENRAEHDHSFMLDCAQRLGARIPAMAGAPFRLARTCALDITPDGRPLLGPAGPEGLFLAAGWSGSGFGKGPATGAELARWILDGRPRRPGLWRYTLDRFAKGEPIAGEHEYGATGPH
ncbi:NAD(P)/FAD-dependent oxidoreductase [Sciscionella sediminilitoris]|uniref:NAD(P)/FAD-dependent oxidoreductase n=1 Tax=Sciscionella sediminilitoris TaxID=1445613 RepID=UPI0005629EDE|nr:FAD-binding oxidoreductase [Sciscionella sp. SE31]